MAYCSHWNGCLPCLRHYTGSFLQRAVRQTQALMASRIDKREQPGPMVRTAHAAVQGADLALITLRMQHHAAASGYHRLTDALPAAVISGRRPSGLIGRMMMKLLSGATARSGSLWYNRVSLVGELEAAGRWLKTRNQIFHFLYGENSYRYLGALKNLAGRGNRLLATYHTPTWRMRELISDTDHIKRLDAAVVVSTTQRAYFENLLGSDRVFFVPHGIDTEFFVPTPTPRDATRGSTFRFVCVGHHLRDFATLAAAADILWQQDPSIEIVVVADPERLGALARLPNVRTLSRIDDERLRALYQQSDALLLPLLDATANNSLLEGMACGLPVISTDLGGVRDYVCADGCVLTPKGDATALAAAAQQARDGLLDLDAMSSASRRAAEHLSWPRVAQAMQRVYQTVSDLSPHTGRNSGVGET
jgi:glycosyltransferase involved in cell wall biosynthesis